MARMKHDSSCVRVERSSCEEKEQDNRVEIQSLPCCCYAKKGRRKKKSHDVTLLFIGHTVLYVQYVQLGCQPKKWVGREKRFVRHKIDTKRTQHFQSTCFPFQTLPCLLRTTCYHSVTGE